MIPHRPILLNFTGLHKLKFYFTALLLASIIGSLSAQYQPTIRTARPGQSIGPFTVGKNIFQVQSGFDAFGSKNKNSGEQINGVLHNTVIRYGLAERFEISTLINYNSVTKKIFNQEEKTSGLDALDIGCRYEIFESQGILPNIGFQVRFRLPVLSEDYKIDHLAPRFILVTNQKISKTFTLFTNWGGAWDGNNGDFVGSYTINLAFPITKKLGSYVENYGNISNGKVENRWDTGIGYLVTNNFQLDTYGGYGQNHGVRDWFISIGISVRTDRK